jgi:RNA polymerase sigma-70 factor, ECF subfamily
MLSIARHEVADYYRRKYAKKALQTLPLSDFLLSLRVDDSSEVSLQVRKILSQMSEYSRELLLRKYVDGKKVAELAKEMGRSAKSIESELFRARREFRTLWLAQE